MEVLGGVLGAILIAIFISAIFYFALNARGPWGSLWTFFLVLLLVVWAASLWVRPIGPVYWGIAWIPLFFVGILMALLLAAIPAYGTREAEIEDTGEDVIIVEEKSRVAENPQIDPAEAERRSEINRTAATVTGTFWVLLVILLIVIILGYMV